MNIKKAVFVLMVCSAAIPNVRADDYEWVKPCAIAAGAAVAVGGAIAFIKWLVSETDHDFERRIYRSFESLKVRYSDSLNIMQRYTDSKADTLQGFVRLHSESSDATDAKMKLFITGLSSDVFLLRNSLKEVFDRIESIRYTSSKYAVCFRLKRLYRTMEKFQPLLEQLNKMMQEFKPYMITSVGYSCLQERYKECLAFVDSVGSKDIAMVVRYDNSSCYPYVSFIEQVRSDRSRFKACVCDLRTMSVGDQGVMNMVRTLEQQAEQFVNQLEQIEKVVVVDDSYTQELQAREMDRRKQEQIEILKREAAAREQAAWAATQMASAERDKAYAEWSCAYEMRRANECREQELKNKFRPIVVLH